MIDITLIIFICMLSLLLGLTFVCGTWAAHDNNKGIMILSYLTSILCVYGLCLSFQDVHTSLREPIVVETAEKLVPDSTTVITSNPPDTTTKYQYRIQLYKENIEE